MKLKFNMAEAGTDTGTGGGGGSGGDTILTGAGNGAGNNGGSNGGQGGGAGGDKGAGTGGGAVHAWHSLPDKWQETLPEDIRGEDSLKGYKDFPSIAKTLVHAQKAIGADKIVVPGKNATSEDWKQVWKKLGMPDKEKYDFKAPESFANQKELVEKLKGLAVEKGILPSQMQSILDFFADGDKSVKENQKVQVAEFTKKQIDGLKEEWGAKFDINVQKAKRALDTFGSPELGKLLSETGLGNNPNVIKAFAKMGETLAEDTLHGAGAGAGGHMVMTPAEAQSKITAIYGNTDHPLHKQGHVEHDKAVLEMEQLHKYAYPEPVDKS